MSEAMSTLIIISAEFGVVLLILFVMLVVMFIKRRTSDKQYVTSFIADHKSSQAGKQNEMRELMASESLLSGKDLDQFLNDIALLERKLYKRILNMYLGFDRKCLPEIRHVLSQLNQSWIGTLQKNKNILSSENASEETTHGLKSKIDVLTAENLKINSELTEAMETMEDILKEYSLMYAGQGNEKMDKLSNDFQKLKDKSNLHGS